MAGCIPACIANSNQKAGRPDLIYRMVDQLGSKRVAKRAGRGTTIAYEGDDTGPFIFVINGWIATTKSLSGGQTQITDLVLPNEFLLLATDVSPMAAFSVEALTDVDYVLLFFDTVNGCSSEAARLRRYITGDICGRQARLSALMLRLGRASAESRIAFAIMELFVRLEAAGEVKGQKFHTPINQHQLGDFVGLSNVHVCRTLRRMVRQGIMSINWKTGFEILDIDALCHLADIDMDEFRLAIIPDRAGLAQPNSTFSPEAWPAII
tara:strand:+ start:40221 stop:41018 length:798 start_codon:yes stop_codon:yes gene_type:complete